MTAFRSFDVKDRHLSYRPGERKKAGKWEAEGRTGRSVFTLSPSLFPLPASPFPLRSHGHPPIAIGFLVVWATTRCQLRCRYCYMSAGDTPEIDLDVRAFAAAARHLGLGPGAEVQIAGGEPLLVPDVVEDIAARARSLGVTRVAVQTNGIGIDERFVALVKRHRLAVGVSLDGPPAVNDRARGRSAEVLRGLARLEAAGIPFGVTAVVSRDTVATLPDLALLLAGFAQARSLGLDILRPAGRARETDLAAPAELRQAFAALVERLEWVNRHRRAPLRLRELAAAECGGTPGRCPGESGRGAALTADGALYPCASLAGLPEFQCGTARAPDYARLRRGLPFDASACGGCAVAGCHGRCPSLALLSKRAGRLDCLLRQAASRRPAADGDAITPSEPEDPEHVAERPF
ncbi:MAG: radical SAM protein [Candidatus Accumulibacter sp.]|jgi:uncharacterized protein|nr:radical SAM protein [Accumulibacter sp.]